jgi:hypothetical protein
MDYLSSLTTPVLVTIHGLVFDSMWGLVGQGSTAMPAPRGRLSACHPSLQLPYVAVGEPFYMAVVASSVIALLMNSIPRGSCLQVCIAAHHCANWTHEAINATAGAWLHR